MRLADLDPAWLTFEQRRVGFIFRSPTKRDWWQTCFVEGFRTLATAGDSVGVGPWNWALDSQAGIIELSAPQVGPSWQGCNPDCSWTIDGGIAAATFDTLTVTPSLDGSRGGLWHGFITNGAIVGGI